MKRKVRKYAEGGFGDDDYERNENREGRMSTLDSSDIEDAIRGRQMAGTLGKVEYPNRMREAAEAAGTAGEDTGVGQLAGTRPINPAAKPPVRTKPPGASAVKPPVKTPTSAAPMGRTAMGKTAEQEMAALETGRTLKGKAELERLQKEDKPLEPVTPEKNLIGGVPLRGAKAMASGLKEMGSYLKNRFGKEVPKVAGQLGQSGKRADNLTKDMGPVELATQRNRRSQIGMESKGEGPIRAGMSESYRPKALQASGEAAKSSGEVATKNGALARRGETPKQLESPKPRLPNEKNMGRARLETEANKRRQLKRNSRSEDTIEMGMKSGGKVGSASRRGDGIAMRGKTRGRYI